MVKSVIFFGASRGCGHHAALKLLSGPDPPQCTFLLRKPDALLKSTGFEGLGADVRESKVHIVTGDATDQAKVDEAVKLADKLGGGKIDTVVYSIGGAPVYVPPFTFRLDNPDVTKQTFTAVLRSLHALSPSAPLSTRVFVVSSNGLTDHTHNLLPWPVRFFFTAFLREPHVDKAALENLVNHASKENLFRTKETTPSAHLLSEAEVAEIVKDVPAGFLAVPPVIVQPALLTSGPEKGLDKVRSGPALPSVWTVSRADTGAWIANEVDQPTEGLYGPVVLAY